MTAGRYLIFGWSHAQGALECLTLNETLAEVASVIVGPSLPPMLRTALGRSEAVVVVHPESAKEHELIEEFLLAIDRGGKANTHYVIVVSAQGKRFKSGVQSHSVINTFDENAILRATLHGVMMLSHTNEAKVERDEVSGEIIRLEEPLEHLGGLPKPSLMDYFKLPAFRKASPILAGLVVGERENLAMALGELSALSVADLSPVDRVMSYLLETRSVSVRAVSRADLPPELYPPEGEGMLVPSEQFSTHLDLPVGQKLRFCWVEELDLWIVSWGGTTKDGAFAQALLYTVLRIRMKTEAA